MQLTTIVTGVRTAARRLRWRLRPPRPMHRPRCVATGPAWFRTLVADSFDIVRDDAADSSLPRFTWSADDSGSGISAPFVSPSRSYPGSLRRVPRAAPGEFHDLDAAARRRPDDRVDGDDWLVRAHRLQRAARAARSTTIDRVAPAAATGATARPTEDDIDVVCVSLRVDMLPDVIDQFDRQTHDRRTLTIIRTAPAVDAAADDRLRALCRGRDDITVIDRPGVALGACLNEALSSGSSGMMAKWDDDDLYGPHFLSDLRAELRATGAAVVGKHSYCAYLTASDRTYLRFPGRSHRDVTFLAGGTLLIDRSRTTVRFPEVDLGEDRGFLDRCVDAGLRIRSADPFNYVQIRNSQNTWQIADAEFVAGGVLVGEGLDLDAVHV